MKKSNTMKFLLALSALIATGCGTGIDPVGVAVGNGTLPQLSSISTTSPGGQLTGFFSATTPYWTFANLFAFGGNYLAPADGIVAQIGFTTINSTQVNYVTILHTGGRLASRFYGVQNIVVREGDSVFAQQAVGTFYNGAGVTFQVLLDGNPVCPMSFMSATFRANFNSLGFNPCQ